MNDEEEASCHPSVEFFNDCFEEVVLEESTNLDETYTGLDPAWSLSTPYLQEGLDLEYEKENNIEIPSIPHPNSPQAQKHSDSYSFIPEFKIELGRPIPRLQFHNFKEVPTTRIVLKRTRSLDDTGHFKCNHVCKCHKREEQNEEEEEDGRVRIGDLLKEVADDENPKISAETLSSIQFNQLTSYDPDDIGNDELRYKTDYYEIMNLKSHTKRDAGEVDLIRLYICLRMGDGKPIPEIHEDLYKILKIKSQPKSTLSSAKFKKLIRNNLNYKIKNLTTIYPHLSYYYESEKDWNLPNLRKVPEVLLYLENEELRKRFHAGVAQSKAWSSSQGNELVVVPLNENENELPDFQ